MARRLLPLGLLIAGGTAVAATLALARLAAADLPATAAAFWQSAGAALLLLAWQAGKGGLPPLDRRHRRYYLIAALVGIVVPNALLYTVLPRLGTGLAALATSLSPLLTYALALGLGQERLRPVRLGGLALGLLGTVLILVPRSSLPAPGLAGWMALALLVPASLALGNLYRSRAWPAGTGPTALAAGTLAAAALLLLPASLVEGAGAVLPGPRSAAIVAAMAMLTAGYTLLLFALQRLAGPVYLSQLGYVITAAGMALGMALFGERHGPWVWAAVLAIAAGIALVNRRPP